MLSTLLLFAISLPLCVGDCQVPLYDSEGECNEVCTVAYGAHPIEQSPMWQGDCRPLINGTCYECPCQVDYCEEWAEKDKSGIRECQRSEDTGCTLECYKDESSCEDNCHDGNYDCHEGKGTGDTCYLCLQRDTMYFGVLSEWWFWLIIALIGLLLVAAVVGVIIICCCCKNKQ